MPELRRAFVVSLLAVSAAAAQSSADSSRTFRLSMPSNTPAIQQFQSMLQNVAGVPRVTVDSSTAEITISGSDAQLASGAWLLQRLDSENPAGSSVESGIRGTDEVIRVLYLGNTRTGQSLNEMIESFRSLAHLDRAGLYTPAHAVAFRATPQQAQVAHWLALQLDLSAEDPARWQPHDYPSLVPGCGALQVHHRRTPATEAALNELIAALHTVADVAAVAKQTSPPALAFCAAPQQSPLVRWMLHQLDTQPAGPAPIDSRDYSGPELDGEITRIYRWNAATPDERWNEALAAVRSSAPPPRKIALCPESKALVVRGTPPAVAAADRILRSYTAAGH